MKQRYTNKILDSGYISTSHLKFNSDVLRLSNDELIISLRPIPGLDILPPAPV